MKVSDLFSELRVFLFDPDGISWSYEELLAYLNESYGSIVGLKPSAGIIREEIELVPGTKQVMPAGSINLVSVERNIAPVTTPIKSISMDALDSLVYDWHSSSVEENAGVPTSGIELYCYDEKEPDVFFVYPGAVSGNKVDVQYRKSIERHDINAGLSPDDEIRLGDEYIPAIKNYIAFKAFSRDTDNTIDVNRATNHLNVFNQLLTGEAQVKGTTVESEKGDK